MKGIWLWTMNSFQSRWFLSLKKEILIQLVVLESGKVSHENLKIARVALAQQEIYFGYRFIFQKNFTFRRYNWS